jgi:hypothetical protein
MTRIYVTQLLCERSRQADRKNWETQQCTVLRRCKTKTFCANATENLVHEDAQQTYLTFRLIFYVFENYENFGPARNRSDWLGDPVPGPGGRFWAPGSGFGGGWGPRKTIKHNYFLQCPNGGCVKDSSRGHTVSKTGCAPCNETTPLHWVSPCGFRHPPRTVRALMQKPLRSGQGP